MTNTELGDKFIALGTLLKDDDATIAQVTKAGLECGLKINFNIFPADYGDDLTEEAANIDFTEEDMKWLKSGE